MEKEFKIKLADEEEKLPQMYWIPKLHKKPYKARFIAGSSSWLSKLITGCLKLVKSHCISYCKTIYDRTGVNAMWNITNNSLDLFIYLFYLFIYLFVYAVLFIVAMFTCIFYKRKINSKYYMKKNYNLI